MSKDFTDAQLREAFAALPDMIAPLEPCIAADTLWDAAQGDLEPERMATVVDHVAACPSCAEAWRLAVAIADEPGAAAEEPRGGEVVQLHPPRRELVADDRPSPARPSAEPDNVVQLRRWFPIAAGLAVAALALAVLVPIITESPNDDVAPVYRDANAPALETAHAELRAARGDVRLDWSGAPAGSRYDVTVTTASLDAVAHARGLAEPTWTLPAADLADLPAGAVLLWRVEAVSPTGERTMSPTWKIIVE